MATLSPSIHVVKVCPECGGTLVVRVNEATGTEFLGCSQFPECSHAEPLPELYRMEAVGAAKLPGF